MSKPRNLAILLFDDAEVLDFCGPFEVFSVASNQTESPSFNVFTVAENSPVTARNGLSVNPDYALDDCPTPDLLLIPGGIGSRKEMNNKPLADWIGRAAESAELVLSVCTGALLLGKAGLLDGLEATTHHVAYDLLREIVLRRTFTTAAADIPRARWRRPFGVLGRICSTSPTGRLRPSMTLWPTARADPPRPPGVWRSSKSATGSPGKSSSK